jgi:phytol kinase
LLRFPLSSFSDGFSTPLPTIPPIGWQILVVAVWLGLIGLLAEGLRRSGGSAEAVRKVVHMGTGNVILLAWWLDMPAWMGIAASILFGIVTLLSYRFPILPGLNSVGRKSFGTFFYAVSIGVLTAAFWQTAPYYAVMGILIMVWGDGLAALIGQRWGNHPYKLWGMQKSWEGSLTMFGMSYIVSVLLLTSIHGNMWQSWLISLVVAITGTTLEAFSKLGIDNLTVPIGSAIVAFWLNQALLV